jgi:Rod binding domain-containing protein
MMVQTSLSIAPTHRNPEFDEILQNPQKLKLRNACQEFEAVMTSMIMKEGLKSSQSLAATGGDEETDKGSEMFKEVAYEQIAHFIGKQGLMGLGDLLYKQMAAQLDRIKETNNHDPEPTASNR